MMQDDHGIQMDSSYDGSGAPYKTIKHESSCQRYYNCIKGQWWFDFGKFIVTVAVSFCLGMWALQSQMEDIQDRVTLVSNNVNLAEQNILNMQTQIQPLTDSLSYLNTSLILINDTLSDLDIDDILQNVSMLDTQTQELTVLIAQLNASTVSMMEETINATENLTQIIDNSYTNLTTVINTGYQNLSQYNETIWDNLVAWSYNYEEEMEETLESTTTTINALNAKCLPIWKSPITVATLTTPTTVTVNISKTLNQNCSVAIFQYTLSFRSNLPYSSLSTLSFISSLTTVTVQDSVAETSYISAGEVHVPLNKDGTVQLKTTFQANAGFTTTVNVLGCYLS